MVRPLGAHLRRADERRRRGAAGSGCAAAIDAERQLAETRSTREFAGGGYSPAVQRWSRAAVDRADGMQCAGLRAEIAQG